MCPSSLWFSRVDTLLPWTIFNVACVYTNRESEDGGNRIVYIFVLGH